MNQDPISTEIRGPETSPISQSRRAFLSRVSGLTAATIAGSAVGLPALLETKNAEVAADEIGPLSAPKRRDEAYHIRHHVAQEQKKLPLPSHPDNNDEKLYPNKIASFSKGLPHNPRGEVDLNAYRALIRALTKGDPADFEAIPLGCPDPARRRRLVNPQAGLAFDLEGTDSHQFAIPAAPAFASAEEAGEFVENCWMALLRDVPFAEYDVHPLARAATDDLSRLSDFRGPRVGGRVTSHTLFRGHNQGDLIGPYISQFLWLPAPLGAQYIEQRMFTLAAGIDYMTQYADWLNVQNGCLPQQAEQFDPVRRYIINGRDLSQWVHVDVLFQAYFNACQILLTPPHPSDPFSSGIGAPLNPGNPYNYSQTQDGFGTFGAPYINTILTEVATRALKAVWYQKWFVHRRLRPEEYGGRVHVDLTGGANYPIHADVLTSHAPAEIFSRYRTFLLPMAYPEGCPLHPAYGAGHATVAGACVTILKAMFDERYIIPNPQMPDPDQPNRLIPYTGHDADRLTVGGELNKLASNIAIGRNIAGVHWRSDAVESLKLGEAVAISILRDQRATYNEDFDGFTFTKFDGTTITV